MKNEIYIGIIITKTENFNFGVLSLLVEKYKIKKFLFF